MSNLSKEPPVWDWELHNNDCCQYFRKIGPKTYEMIQCIWLDTTDEDIQNSGHRYVVVTGKVDLNDLTEEEIEIAISAFGYTLAEFETWEEEAAESMIAECHLEDEMFGDSYVIAGFNSFEETEDFVEKWVAKHQLCERVDSAW